MSRAETKVAANETFILITKTGAYSLPWGIEILKSISEKRLMFDT